ncbi:MAG: SpoIID/LytB domain-containing protein [Polyangiaceae bacterium]|nr:SpoIID/LytB domain-containing protein [Polyangiaceae bacterium]
MAARTRLCCALAVLSLAACGEDRGPEPVGTITEAVKAPLASAYCQINVNGVNKDTETDYLPHVITCENGGANLEALKAQAIAARSVAYYAMATSGKICDGQGCQVYTCGAAPQAKHFQAVKETSGMYLSYDSMLTYGFYVAGDKDPPPPACKGSGASSTEKWITYNEGKTGAGVKMTALGYIPPSQPVYGQNRGCMGQWSARCLENSNGYDYDKILRFFYGADIQILQATGACVAPVNQSPQGFLDEASCSTLRGWAYDPDQPAKAIEVDLYVDVAPGQAGATPITVTANVSRPDLCAAIGSCEHGFELPTPAALQDGQAHTVWAVGVDASGAPEKELGASPKTLTCAAGSGGAAGSSGSGGAAGSGGGAVGGGGGAGGTSTGTGASGQTTKTVKDDAGGCSCSAPGTGRSPRLGGLFAFAVLAGCASIRRGRRQSD